MNIKTSKNYQIGISSQSSALSDLEKDALHLFLGTRQGHMEKWEYGTSLYLNDPAGGSAYWADLVHNPGNYYLPQGDYDIIRRFVCNEQSSGYLRGIETVIELGPGSQDSIRNKTMPFLSVARDVKRYIAIDSAVDQAKDAASLIQSEAGIQSHAIEQDFFYRPVAKKFSGGAAIVMWGSSLGNIEGHADTSPFKKLAYTLGALAYFLDSGDKMFLCFDMESNEKKVTAAYREIALRSQILSVLHRLKRDTAVTGNFDPRVWVHEPVWFSDSMQCAHTIFPMFDQTMNIGGHMIVIPAWRRFISNNSYKFRPDVMIAAAKDAGLKAQVIQQGPMAMLIAEK